MFNAQQEQDFADLMEILEGINDDNDDGKIHILHAEEEKIIQEELNSAKNKATAV